MTVVTKAGFRSISKSHKFTYTLPPSLHERVALRCHIMSVSPNVAIFPQLSVFFITPNQKSAVILFLPTHVLNASLILHIFS